MSRTPFPQLRFPLLLLALNGALALAPALAPSTLADDRKGASPSQPPPVPARVDMPVDGKLREAATRELEKGLQSPQVMARVHAVEAVKDALGRDGADWIVTRLRDPAPEVRFAALMASGELRFEGARQSALDMVGDNSRPLRIAARFALHRLGDTRLSHDFEKTIHDPDVSIRAKSVFALGLLGEPSAVALLKPMQRDPEAGIRLQVGEALWRLHDEDGLKTLVAASMSGHPDDQLVALPALVATHDRRVIQHVRNALTSDYVEVDLCAAGAMGELGSDEGTGIALQGARSKNPMHRMLAALALGAIGRTDAQPTLSALLKDKEADVRLAAAVAVLKLSPTKADDSPATITKEGTGGHDSLPGPPPVPQN